MPVPTKRLALVVLAGAAVAAVLSPTTGVLAAIIVVNAIIVLAAVFDWASGTRTRDVSVDRVLAPSAVVGAETTLRWTLSNPTDRPLRVAVADDVAPSFGSLRRAHLVVPPRGRASASVTLQPTRRGRFELAGITLRVDGRMGLAARQRHRRLPGVIRVLPSFPSKAAAELRIDRARLLEVGLRSAPGRGGGTEFDQLRDYTPDDEFGRIDWSATARSGKPIVRSYRAERNQPVVLLIDTGRVMAGRVAGAPRLEHALDAAMTLTTVAARLGDRTGLLAFCRGSKALVLPAAGPTQHARVVEAIFDLEAELVESDYSGAFVETLARFRRRALLVLLTDLVEQAIEHSLLPALPTLAARHIVLVGAVTDPDVELWARSVPADSDEAFRKAAAVATLNDRRRAAARLRALGVDVVDGPPQRLATDLVDGYLRVKATGRL